MNEGIFEEIELVAELRIEDEADRNSIIMAAINSCYLVSAAREYNDLGSFTGCYFIMIYKFKD